MSIIFHDQVLNLWNPEITQTVGAMSPEQIFKFYVERFKLFQFADLRAQHRGFDLGFLGCVVAWGLSWCAQ